MGVARHRADLERVLAERLQLSADGRLVVVRWTTVRPARSGKSLTFEWDTNVRNPAALALDGPMFPYDPPHESYVNGYVDGRLVHQDLLDRARTHTEFATGARGPGVARVAATFFGQGVHHIFIGPDHILFVVGLVLLGGTLARLLKVVTAFTIAHSITLVLAALRIVEPPARIVEPVIALSIVYIGIETLRSLRGGRDARARIAFGFGLVHGFGFAAVLREFGLPAGALGIALGSFNLGVEAGQALIVLAVAPALARVRLASAVVGRRIVVAAAIGIVAAGAFWFVERILAA